MKFSWKDTLASIFAVFGGVVAFAKLKDYSWPLLGSWKGALGVIAVTGLAILLTYVVDFVESTDVGILGVTLAWITAATVIVASLFATTTQAEFVWSTILVGISWLTQLFNHAWTSAHHGQGHYAASH